MADLICADPFGLHCPAGGFHVDPWLPVPLALITHPHGDHARPGSAAYVCAESAVALLRLRLGDAAVIRGVRYGETFRLGAADVSFHPSGHMLGAAQIRVEHDGVVWVISGDYKRALDPTCLPFEPLQCDAFISEATFALPIYRWDEPAAVVGNIWKWWQQAAARGRAALLFCYALGKAQRLLAELLAFTDHPVFVHGALVRPIACYRQAGVSMLPTAEVADSGRKRFAGELILAPPIAYRSLWTRRFGDHETGFVSGWMALRGPRRRRGFDRGFALSDHADWQSLLRTIHQSGARRVLLTHGYTEVLARYLREDGIQAEVLRTQYEGELPDEAASEANDRAGGNGL